MADIRGMFSTPFALEMVEEAVDLAALKRAIVGERAINPSAD